MRENATDWLFFRGRVIDLAQCLHRRFQNIARNYWCLYGLFLEPTTSFGHFRLRCFVGWSEATSELSPLSWRRNPINGTRVFGLLVCNFDFGKIKARWRKIGWCVKFCRSINIGSNKLVVCRATSSKRRGFVETTSYLCHSLTCHSIALAQ